MASSLKASPQGLKMVDQARIRKGWDRQSGAWADAAKASIATLKRFWQKKYIQAQFFIDICESVGLDWQEVVDSRVSEDWGEAPEVSAFYGRTEELATLQQWIIQDRCRVVALLGMGGIGKTALAVSSAEQIKGEFEYFIWRSLRNAPPVNKLLANLFQLLSSQNPSKEGCLPEDIDSKISIVLEYLRAHRCLIILDSVEAILSSGNFAGRYREGYEGYGEFLRRLGEERHQSCLLLIGQENPKEIALLQAQTIQVRTLQLTGLQELEAREILRAKGLSGEETWEILIKRYRGNPLALKLISTTIQELFNGSVFEFIQYQTLVLGKFSDVLEEHFERLSNLENQVMCHLAMKHQPVSFLKLREELPSPLSQSDLMDVLESLLSRSLIDKTKNQDKDESEVFFTLQPVVMKYVTKYHLPPDLSS
ncbi:MAG: NACHT domain-containing protein [Tolypothrix sp. Co-bin9]|nr:NACHT domain-containing protein [Tolypothrix sp. Co-bin9]